MPTLGSIKARLFKPTHAKTWDQNPDDSPWFCKPDAAEILEQRRTKEHLSDADYALSRNGSKTATWSFPALPIKTISTA